VQSRPEAGRLILTAGRRDLSSDADLPVPLAWFRPGGGRPQPLAAGHKVVELTRSARSCDGAHDKPASDGRHGGTGNFPPLHHLRQMADHFLVDDAYGVTGAIRTFF